MEHPTLSSLSKLPISIKEQEKNNVIASEEKEKKRIKNSGDSDNRNIKREGPAKQKKISSWLVGPGYLPVMRSIVRIRNARVLGC